MPINWLNVRWKTQLTSRLSLRQRWRFSERLRRLQPNRRARICCCHTSTSCQSAHAHGRVEGERLANSPQHTITSRESHQKYSTSHRYIRLVVRRAEGSAASSIRGDQCHTEGEEGEAGGACWLTEMIPGFSIGRFSQSEIYRAVAELWMSLKLQIHRLNKTKCT